MATTQIELAIRKAENYAEVMKNSYQQGMNAVKELLKAYEHTADNKLTFSYDDDETPYVFVNVNDDEGDVECYVTELYLDDKDNIIGVLTPFDCDEAFYFGSAIFKLNHENAIDWLEIIQAILVKKGEN